MKTKHQYRIITTYTIFTHFEYTYCTQCMHEKVGSQYTQTRRSVGDCRVTLRKNRLESYSCDSIATMTMSRPWLRVL